MNSAAGDRFSVKILAYCAGVVVLAYWFPFIYLAIFDPNDFGRGGLVLLMTFPVVVGAAVIGLREVYRAIHLGRRRGRSIQAVVLILFCLTISPLLFIAFGILWNVIG